MAESIYVCLENPPEDPRAKVGADNLRAALKAGYPNHEAIVEVVPFCTYNSQEVMNIPLTMLRRAAQDTKKRKATLSGRVVPLTVNSKVGWRASLSHQMLFISTVSSDGTGDWLGTPIFQHSEPEGPFRQVLTTFDTLDKEVRHHVPVGPETVSLSRLILGALQCGSFVQKH